MGERKLGASLVVAILLSVITALAAYAAAGDLDPSFGYGGKAVAFTSGADFYAFGMALQEDGKMVTVGMTRRSDGSSDTALYRFRTNGSLDTSFGINGSTIIDLAYADWANDITIAPNGKIFVAGYYSHESGPSDFQVISFDQDGSFNESFGNYDIVGFDREDRPTDDVANAVVVQPDNKILAVGQTCMTFPDHLVCEFALVRYNTDGSLDESFGDGGKLALNFAEFDNATDVVVQPDGKIIVVGAMGNNAAIIRLNEDGSYDTTFPLEGRVQGIFAAVALQPDGKVVAAGTANLDGKDFLLSRFDSDGSFDSEFGNGGNLWLGFGNGQDDKPTEDQGFDVAVQEDGKIVVVGDDIRQGFGYFGIARVTPDGGNDTSFGTNGRVITGFFHDLANSSPASVAIQPEDGFIVVGGTSCPDFCQVVLARYMPDDQETPDYNLPDGVIEGVGDNVYNLDGAEQSKASNIAKGKAKTFEIEVENDGNLRDSFKLKGPGDSGPFDVTYLKGSSGATNITSEILKGTYVTAKLDPGKSAIIRLKIKVDQSAGSDAKGSWLLKIKSSGTPTRIDAVKAKATVP